jgi:hypothetical protein
MEAHNKSLFGLLISLPTEDNTGGIMFVFTDTDDIEAARNIIDGHAQTSANIYQHGYILQRQYISSPGVPDQAISCAIKETLLFKERNLP